MFLTDFRIITVVVLNISINQSFLFAPLISQFIHVINKLVSKIIKIMNNLTHILIN